ncbi:hypothetical protein GGI20_004086 [Coemansia sp. BCRC 34301]|nr:hypothetical protein GGI20_004086 [Coemansia sp. BCRC 34301]
MSPSATRFLSRVLTVPSHAAGQRADRYIQSQINIPASLVYRLLRKRAITEQTTNGRLQGSDRVHVGMRIQIPSSLETPSETKSEATDEATSRKRALATKRLRKLFENDAVAVLLKPAGLACQGGTGVRHSVDTMLGDLDSTGGYRLVHRLDRDTTGALVVARTRLAAASLGAAFRDRTVTKRYIALLLGIPGEPRGVITNPLINTGATTRVASNDKAKPATTTYRVLCTGQMDGDDVAIVEVGILTGRKHQIRAHCAHVLKCPVYGDNKYSTQCGPMFLHLFEITVPDVDAMGNVRDGNASGTISVRAPFPATWIPVFKALDVKTNLK